MWWQETVASQKESTYCQKFWEDLDVPRKGKFTTPNRALQESHDADIKFQDQIAGTSSLKRYQELVGEYGLGSLVVAGLPPHCLCVDMLHNVTRPKVQGKPSINHENQASIQYSL